MREATSLLGWQEHLDTWEWAQGDHVTLIGPTKAGKTTLARAILPRRSYVVVLASKNRDPSLDKMAREDGYRIVRRWSDVGHRRGGDRVMLWPARPGRLQSLDADEAEARQYEEFKACLDDLYQAGAWTPYFDELGYLHEILGLEREMKRLWAQGRSDGITVVASCQSPVYIPRTSLDQVVHMYLWRNRDRSRQRRLADVSGAFDLDQFGADLGTLAHHEVLYVDGTTGETRRTMVDGRV